MTDFNEKDESSKKETEALKKKLQVTFTNTWDRMNDEELNASQELIDNYKLFLDQSKTEREFVTLAIEELEADGFVEVRSKDKLVNGDKVYHSINGKALLAAVIGQEAAVEGFNLVGAHVDSPRLDLKPYPIYEDNEMVLLKTHYYGGVKKYQWTTIPLALHGTVVKADGEVVSISIGEKDEDPIFYISDLLIHLSREQMAKTASQVITGEELNVIFGGRPYPEETGGRFKLGVLKLLYDAYGITEHDLTSAELYMVPAYKARDIGLDRTFIGAYGHDDRVCAYPALAAIKALNNPTHTSVIVLSDKEEVGSQGNTGAASKQYETFLADLFTRMNGSYDELAFRYAIENSKMLSADVTNGFDPTFASASDPRNSAYMGRGIGLVKATGSGGKGGASDANSEFMASVTRLFDQNGVAWQTGEMGKVDQGGGGTIAKFFANLGMQVLDCGVPVLSMHAPMEVVHRHDVYYTYAAYKCFMENI